MSPADAKEWHVRIITIVNQKGGCGKTTTAVNLSAALARGGLRTLLVDLDPQSHCAVGLGVPESKIDLDISDVLVMPSSRPIDTTRLLWRVGRNFDLAPSRMKLAGLEATRGGLADKPDKERRLAQVLDRLKNDYDVALVDCSPAIGLLTFNALAAAHTVVIPVETGFFALQGATRQLTTVKALAKKLNVEIPIVFVPTLHDEASTVSHDLLGELRRRFGHQVAPIVIRRDAKLREAASFGQPAIDHAPDAPGSKDYIDLSRWIGVRLGLKLSTISTVAEPNWQQSLLPVELKPEIDTPKPNTPASIDSGVTEPRSTTFDVASATIEEVVQSAAIPADSTPGTGVATPLAASAATSPAFRPLATTSPVDVSAIREALLASTRSSPQTATAPATTATIAAPDETRPTSRAAELVYRAQKLLRRVAGESTESEAISTTPLRLEQPVNEPKPVRAEPDRRILGVRVTAQGVLFVQPASLGQTVSIAGSFNNWSTTAHQMHLNPELGVFELCVQIAPGTHQYRLVVDGAWTADPHNAAAEVNPFGELNSVVTVQGIGSRRMDDVLESRSLSINSLFKQGAA
ncbi:MAG: AAA family ATPase [Phycisphaerales bacterium]|nr:AAA family ATPase [Phycisphaerales bacterium]